MSNSVDVGERLIKAQQFVLYGMWDELLSFLAEENELAVLCDYSGETLLFFCSGKRGCAQIIKKLCELGANPNYISHAGVRPLSPAICGENDLEGVVGLLDAGADPNLDVDCGMPALHWSIAQAKIDCAKLLIERGADLMALTQDCPAESALDIAKRMTYKAAIEMLMTEAKPPDI